MDDFFETFLKFRLSLVILNVILPVSYSDACSGGKYAHDIYSYLSKALDKSIQHSRYDVPRSALQLLAKHACQWDQCIIDDYKVIVDIASSLVTVFDQPQSRWQFCGEAARPPLLQVLAGPHI